MINCSSLTTQRLKLLEIGEGDAPDLFKLYSDSSVTEYLDIETLNMESQADELIQFLMRRAAAKLGMRWAIRIHDSGEFIGSCGLNSINVRMRNGTIGYDIHPMYQGQGYAYEALQRMIAAAFSGQLECGSLHRIQADTVPDNVASEALLLKMGFKKEGLRRSAGYWGGRFYDLNCFGLLEQDFSGRSSFII